ncbi:MAG: DNA-directed RNA polymerase subunit alpha [Dehalococcoidia bacterium]|nr:DNA-directed RNA polymerase subunit alpha [Chloroflexota bacterium]MBT9160519.1 DNA-directed RNA polymerase subunit alpha [Chloroflexota bacterium]MBT9162156.1 DNA-directed RNA polymerase subunit alpha [Chloroflexota bacterium]
MPEIVSPSIDYRLVSENYGHFVIEPLYPGYGLTLGNALRRVLLGSLPGAAVTAVKIDGIQHEFSTIPHMKEDTMEFMLNVKGIRLRYLSDRPDKLSLEASGEGEVRAGDIKSSADFEIVNPDHHLATLDSPEAKLNVEFTVEIGRGYVRTDSRDGRFIGVLPIDAVFTPIRRVNYKVEKAKVEDRDVPHPGRDTHYDRLIIDVLTDGTISPDDAVATSARILTQQFSIFSNLGRPPEAVAMAKEPPLPAGEMTLDQLGLTSRTYNTLLRAGITSLAMLLGKTRKEFIDLKHLGPKSWDEIQKRLVAVGIVEKGKEGDREATITHDLSPITDDEEEVPEDLERDEMVKKLQERFLVREDK